MTAKTDRELLEQAAKAAGIRITEYRSGGLPWTIEHEGGKRCMWQPLNDDGDALRLACKLGMAVDFSTATACIGPDISICEGGYRDAVAARRVIVRAAAIGEAKP